MPKYRKKPVVIEAVQFVKEDIEMDLAKFLRFSERPHYREGNDLIIRTLEGDMRATPGDWIIRGVAGEFYPIKDQIFREIYEKEDGSEI